MLFSSKKIVQELVCQYQAAKNFDYNEMATIQVSLIEKLCSNASKEAFEAVGQIMTSSYNHEYLDFAIPEILAKYIRENNVWECESALAALITGMKEGHNETIRDACIQKLAESQHVDVYHALLEYRNFLLLDKANRPKYWSFLFRSVIAAATALTPYVEESLRVPTQLLRQNRPI